MARIESIRKIYSDGRHNAFTDMGYWKGQYYVSFRNGPRHPTLPGMWGSGMIIRSSDLESWELCARFEMEGVDTSNPRLMNLGDELGALGRAIYSKKPGLLRLYEGPSGVQPYVRCASDGSTWSDPEAVLENDDFFWRPVRVGDFWYMAGRRSEELTLVRSSDTRDWQAVSTIPPASGMRFSEEAELWVAEDERMQVIVRAQEDMNMACLAESEPPYVNWELTELEYTVHCAACQRVGDEIWVAGKAPTEQFPSSVEIPPAPTREKMAALAWRDGRLCKTPDWHTAIWRFVDGRLEPLMVFPSGGDCGYPDMVVEENRVLVSYYSQHDVDNGPDPSMGECPNEIYLAEISL